MGWKLCQNRWKIQVKLDGEGSEICMDGWDVCNNFYSLAGRYVPLGK